jgi:hypothetical protein
VTARKPAASPAQKEIAAAKQRAKNAKTPLAKAVTKRVVESMQRTHSGKGAREASAQMRLGVSPVDAGTPRGRAQASQARKRARG